MTYAGWIREATWGEGDDILFLSDEDEPLARRIQDDMDAHGSYLSVRYWTAPNELSEEDRTDIIIRAGLGEATVGHAYSDVTGYLWTDEEINVGGHDLIEELHSHVGEFCHLEISFSREPRRA